MSSSSTSTGASASTSKLPDWIEGEAKSIFEKAKSYANSDFEAYDYNRVAPVSTAQKQAKGYLASQLGRDVTNQPLSWVASAANYRTPDLNAQQVQRPGEGPSILSERVVDEGGQLGKMSDYINPHVQNALNPALREMMEAGQKQRNFIGANAAQAGAFGDARHGIVEGEQMEAEGRNVGDLSYQAYADAFNQAMQHRQTDASRLSQLADKDRDRAMEESIRNADLRQRTGEFNANLSENTLNRLLAASDRWSNIMDTDADNKAKEASLLAALGQQEQSVKQKELDVAYQDWFDWMHQQRDDVNFLLSTLQGIPYEKSTVTNTSTTTPNNSNAGLFGSLLGSFF